MINILFLWHTYTIFHQISMINNLSCSKTSSHMLFVVSLHNMCVSVICICFLIRMLLIFRHKIDFRKRDQNSKTVWWAMNMCWMRSNEKKKQPFSYHMNSMGHFIVLLCYNVNILSNRHFVCYHAFAINYHVTQYTYSTVNHVKWRDNFVAVAQILLKNFENIFIYILNAI